jgi:UMF1 family MFS transporter
MVLMSSTTTPASIPVARKEIFGWAMFDFANSSYTTVIITAVYSSYFIETVVPAGSRARDIWWSAAMVASTLIALVLSPLAGAICDKKGSKKPYLLASTLTCALSTAALALVGPGDVYLAVFLIAISNAAFMLSETFCASYLPELATPETMGKISGLGWGLGYFGGLASLALVTVLIGGATGEALDPKMKLAVVVTGAFFLLAALPTLLLVRTRSRPAPGFEHASTGELMRAGFAELRETARNARQHSVLFRFLVAFMVYMAGLDAVIKFVGIYARSELHFDTGEIAVMFLVLQLSAAAGALAFGWLEARAGAKTTVLSTLGLWVLAILAIYGLDSLAGVLGVTPKTAFYGLSLVAGMGIGATQSSSRAVVGLLAPPERSAEMFGFWGTFARLGSILGMSFGVVSDVLDRRTALLVVVAFFVVGAGLLARVPIPHRPQPSRS